jgi:DNA-binding transcriptional MerR regulator
VDERDPDLLSIGRFARLAGLSIGALRHYDELDLLRPAWTDPATSYRYHRRRRRPARRPAAELELPLDEIRLVSGRRPGRSPSPAGRHRSGQALTV